MKIAYADPPYIGCAWKYRDHPDYSGEVDHAELILDLYRKYDGFVLHCSSVSLDEIVPNLNMSNTRIMAWVKPFAAFKRNVSVAYAWEPVIVKSCRKPVVSGRIVMRDFISCNITMKKGLCGVKPKSVILWALEMVGASPEDDFFDLYPGTGIVEKTWQEWKASIAKAKEEK